MSLFVVEQRVRQLGAKRQPDTVRYLKECEQIGSQFDCHWTADINEAFLFHDEAETPTLKNHTEGDTRFSYDTVEVNIVPVRRDTLRGSDE